MDEWYAELERMREEDITRYAPMLRDALAADAEHAIRRYESTGSISVGTENLDTVLRGMYGEQYAKWAEHEYGVFEAKGFFDLMRKVWRAAGHRYFERAGRKKAKLMAETTQRDMEALAAEAIANGQVGAALAIFLRTRLPELFDRRAYLVASGETVASAEAGRMAGAMAAGATTKTWFTTLDNRTRRGERGYDHAAAHLQTQSLHNPFVVSGEFLMHPGDGSMGAQAGNLVNCRCATIFS